MRSLQYMEEFSFCKKTLLSARVGEFCEYLAGGNISLVYLGVDSFDTSIFPPRGVEERGFIYQYPNMSYHIGTMNDRFFVEKYQVPYFSLFYGDDSGVYLAVVEDFPTHIPDIVVGKLPSRGSLYCISNSTDTMSNLGRISIVHREGILSIRKLRYTLIKALFTERGIPNTEESKCFHESGILGK